MKEINKSHLFISLLLFCIIATIGCRKFLDKKSNQSLVIPSTIQDLQALLDYFSRVNQEDPSAGETSAGDYYLTNSSWSSISAETDKRMYIWEKSNLFEGVANDWSYTYDNVYRANVVLENIRKISRTASNQKAWDDLKGQGYFLRAKSFLQAAFIWTQAYDQETSNNDFGIPLRLDPDFNKVSVRSNIEQSFRQIINDLEQSIPLLPAKAIHVLRPCKGAAYALLARTYLSMRIYDKALLYADSSLVLNNTLLDYNTVDAGANYPFAPRFDNPEDIMDTYMQLPESLLNSNARIDSNLYQSYSDSDLRKNIFFKPNTDGSHSFKGSYTGNIALFDGIAIDEVYLMKAECLARAGNPADAMDVLNQLLVKRWKSGTFIPFTAANKTEAVNIILTERRKELLMRGLRWMDIKRLNKEGANITLTRILNGQTYTLPPNDLRYALPIPEDVISISGMQQNP